MKILICYDIAQSDDGKKRLRKVAKICEDFGVRVQYSIFECVLDPHEWENAKNKLLQIMDRNNDSFRFYFLGKNWENRVEHVGSKPAIDMDKGNLIF